MSVFDVLDIFPRLDLAEARVAMELGRRRYALRVARSALRGISALLAVMIVVRLIVSPAFRHRVATWQYITGLIGGTLAVSLLIGVLTAVTLSRVFGAIIARERAGLPPLD